MVPQVLSFDPIPIYIYICKLNTISSLSITSVYLQVTAEAKLQVSDDDGHEMMARRSIILCDCIATFLNFETYRIAEGTLPSAASQFSVISYQPFWAKPLQSKKYNANIHGICQLIAKHTVNGLVMCQVCARVQKSTMPNSKGFQKRCWEMMCLIHLIYNLHYRLDWKQKHMCIVESQRSTHSASKWHQIFSILESHHQPINQTKQSVE